MTASPITRFTGNCPQSTRGVMFSMTTLARLIPTASARRQEQGRERRQTQREGMMPPARRQRRGFPAPEVAGVAAAVVPRITVETLLPVAATRSADAEVIARHRREVADDQHHVARVVAFAQEGESARLGVVAVNPFEAIGGKVPLVECRRVAIEAVQVLDPTPHAGVMRILQHVPFQTLFMRPLAFL